MKNKRNTKVIIDIIFSVLLFISIVLFIKNKNNDQVGFVTLIENLIWIVIIISSYIGIRMGLKKHHKEKFDKIDFGKYKDYYRDILEEYSPAVLKYIDEFSINISTIIATLMKLELKGIIDEGFQTINNEKYLELDENEKYLCMCLKNSKNIDFYEFEKRVILDCKKYRLLKIKKEEEPAISKFLHKNFFTLNAVVMFLSFMLSILWDHRVIILAFAFPVMSMVIWQTFLVSYGSANKINPYTRSKKGKQINEKLEGLKNYLKDYSALDDKDRQELVIWEDYLIYSVIFNQNEKIIKEYQEKIDGI